MKLKLAIAALAATLSMSSFAGFMIEPYAGFGTYATTLDAAAFEDAEASGETYTSVGARAGYSLLLFSGGLDLEMMATGAAKYDLERFGCGAFMATPRRADLMIVAGTVFSSLSSHCDVVASRWTGLSGKISISPPLREELFTAYV